MMRECLWTGSSFRRRTCARRFASGKFLQVQHWSTVDDSSQGFAACTDMVDSMWFWPEIHT